jgi:hypothetical protein
MRAGGSAINRRSGRAIARVLVARTHGGPDGTLLTVACAMH